MIDHLEEEAVVGGVICWHDRPLPSPAVSIEPEHFESPMNAQIWAAIQELIDSKKPPDLIAVCNLLRKWGEKETILKAAEIVTSAPEPTNLEHWATLVLESGRKRLLVSRLKDAATTATGRDIDDLATIVSEAVKDASAQSQDGGLVHVSDPLKRALNQIEERSKNPDAGVLIRTGLIDLDKKLVLGESELTIVAGRPSMGKTALAGNIAAYCAKDITKGSVAIFSLEQSDVSLIQRLLFRESGINTSAQVRGADFPRLASAMDRLHKLDLHIDDRAGIGVNDMRAQLRKLPKVRLVVVDYLQLAKLPRKSDRRDVELGDVTKGLKEIAKENRCHVIALSQLNRSVEKRSPPVPVLSDLRDSGNIEEDADNVLLLYREEYYQPENPDAEGVADIIIAKQRNGPVGRVKVSWVAERTSFENLTRYVGA